MGTKDEPLVPVFIPSLSAMLVRAEDQKGEPLTYDELIHIRDAAVCVMMPASKASQMDDSRGYCDIDPENCWHDWQHLRQSLGRKPDLDPGPKFSRVRSADPEFQKTVVDARTTLEEFRGMLAAERSSPMAAKVKIEITQGDNRALMWLSNVRMSDFGFLAEFSEVPNDFSNYLVGDQVEVSVESLLDWMVIDNGILHGGFSIRYQRSRLPENERESYDEYIGVTEYS